MERGYYWLKLEDGEPEVVEIDGDSMYRCGSDITCHLEGWRWIEYNVPLDIFSITGPITMNQTAKLDQASDEIAAIAKELLQYVIDVIEDGAHSGSDDPDDYDLVVRAKKILT